MAGRWPFPGDGSVARARRVALAYRAALAEHAPHECSILDGRMRGWGQGWAIPRVQLFEMDDWLDPRDAADLLCTDPKSVATLRRRGRLHGERDAEGRWRYQARDLLALSTDTRRREGRNAGSDCARTVG